MGRLFSASMVSVLLFRKTLYSREPIFADPAGRIRFCALIASETSIGVKPLDCSAGISRSTMVDLDIPALQSRGLTPIDVSDAINAQNLILPAGSAKIGSREYNVFLNSSTETIEALNNLPIKTTGGTTVYI